MTSMDSVMCRIRAPSGEVNYLLEIRHFLWNHRSEKETDLVIISGKECVQVHQTVILPMSDHPIDVLPPSCPCTKPAIWLPPFPSHILTAAVEILYIGKATGKASQEDLDKIKEVFSFLKIKVDVIADDFEHGSISGEHDSGVASRGVIVKIELNDSENNNSIISQDDQDVHSCSINDVKGVIDNDLTRNITEMDKCVEEPSLSSTYLNEITGEFHYPERRNSLEVGKNDKNLDGQHYSSARYLDEFFNFTGNDLNRTNATEGHNFRPIKEEPTSPPSQGPVAKLRPRKRKAQDWDDNGIGLDGKNILSVLKPGNKEQKISTESSKKYPCCKCNYESNDKGNLQRHFERVHQKVSLNCNQCNFQTTHKGYLQKHIACMHNKRFYYCEQCEYKTTRKPMLKVHNNSVHENIFHHCNHCDYKTAMKHNLKTHIESVHEKISYECDKCRYKTTRKDFLKVHIKRKHDGVPNFGNQENGKPINETFLTGKISYYCDQCEYKSTQKYMLKRHIDCIHEKNIFHYCDQCDYKTTWKYNLKTHIESVHQKISYECNDCGYKTTRKDCLKVHIKSKHPGVSFSGYQGTKRAATKETLSRELSVHGEPTSNFQIRTPNLSQDQVVNVSSKSTNSDDHGSIDDEPY